MRKRISILPALVAVLAAVSACVYPFDPGIEGEDGRLVVEGDIHVGSMSTFTFSRVYPLDMEELTPASMAVSAYIEGEDGTRIDGDAPDLNAGRCTLTFDTSELSASQRYRLHFTDTQSGLVYESDWIDVCPAPSVDALTYILDGQRGELNVALSMHCDGRSHFRWYYDEEWEYHAQSWAFYYYEPLTDKLVEFPLFENNYYCWNTYHSPVIKIFSTEEQVEDRFVDLEFHRISRSDKRLQALYQIKVYLEAMNEDAYAYWKNIRDNSQSQGTIFAPTPSQMPGNIHCISDPSVLVIGYINAAEQTVAEMYYDDYIERFYRGTNNFEYIEIKPDEFAMYYDRGYIPFNHFLDLDRGHIYQWGTKRCLDCRVGGGTKDKPSYWPNDHT